MIVSLKGQLLEVTERTIVLDVQGVGYEVIVTNSVLKKMPNQGQELQIQTYLQVRDDAFVLYGFSSSEERDLFHKIIGVAGIGPKLGVGILSNIAPREFIQAVQRQDLRTLTSLPGIGKKTGERILLELKDKFKDIVLESDGEDDDLPVVSGSVFEDAVEALQALGYYGSEAERMVNLAKPHLTENYNLQELLKVALAQNSQQRGEHTWRRNG
ncbi:MAG TPA: Holliday junction branch migration protein RuvA [Firmicutes bacterium]|jgi:Holliday junction DNA helicase RuvA|nr:Holliday junction branch migration protein RuvA [Bacillota bacterium]